jgi:hypothetical protein
VLYKDCEAYGLEGFGWHLEWKTRRRIGNSGRDFVGIIKKWIWIHIDVRLTREW